MAVQDFTDDPRVEMAIAHQIGSAIGGVLKRSREQKQYELDKELNTIMQEKTLEISRSNKPPEQKLIDMNEIKGFAQSELGRRMNERAIMESTARQKAGVTPQDEQMVRIKQIDQLQKNLVNTQMYDEVTQQTVTKPGMEAIASGITNSLKQLTMEAFPQEVEQQRLATQQRLPEPEALQESFMGLEQTEDRTFLDDTFKKTEVMEKIGQRLDTLVQGGMDANQARTQVISEYDSLKAEDQGKFQKLPELDLAKEFGISEEDKPVARTEEPVGVPPSSQPQTALDQEAIAWAGRNIGSSDPETKKQAEDILNINFGTK